MHRVIKEKMCFFSIHQNTSHACRIVDTHSYQSKYSFNYLKTPKQNRPSCFYRYKNIPKTIVIILYCGRICTTDLFPSSRPHPAHNLILQSTSSIHYSFSSEPLSFFGGMTYLYTLSSVYYQSVHPVHTSLERGFAGH